MCYHHKEKIEQRIHSWVIFSWWRHQMETFSASLALCAGNSPITGEFSAQRPVTRSFDVFFDLRLDKRLSKQLWGWWFETPSCSLWRHCNVNDWHDGQTHGCDGQMTGKTTWVAPATSKQLKQLLKELLNKRPYYLSPFEKHFINTLSTFSMLTNILRFDEVLPKRVLIKTLFFTKEICLDDHPLNLFGGFLKSATNVVSMMLRDY